MCLALPLHLLTRRCPIYSVCFFLSCAAPPPRRSRDLESTMDAMTEGKDAFTALAALGKVDTDADIEALFKKIDDDGNGTLDAEEVQKAFKESGKEMSIEDVKALFAQVKDEKSENKETVTLEEFKTIMKPSKEESK